MEEHLPRPFSAEDVTGISLKGNGYEFVQEHKIENEFVTNLGKILAPKVSSHPNSIHLDIMRFTTHLAECVCTDVKNIGLRSTMEAKIRLAFLSPVTTNKDCAVSVQSYVMDTIGTHFSISPAEIKKMHEEAKSFRMFLADVITHNNMVAYTAASKKSPVDVAMRAPVALSPRTEVCAEPPVSRPSAQNAPSSPNVDNSSYLGQINDILPFVPKKVSVTFTFE